MINFYHGTTKEQAASILKNGLLPKGGKGALLAIATDPFRSPFFKGTAMARDDALGERAKSVYLTSNMYWADYFADITSGHKKHDEAILQVSLTPEQLPKITVDEYGTEECDQAWGAMLRYPGTIPASQISLVPTSKVFAVLGPQAGLKSVLAYLGRAA